MVSVYSSTVSVIFFVACTIPLTATYSIVYSPAASVANLPPRCESISPFGSFTVTRVSVTVAPSLSVATNANTGYDLPALPFGKSLAS
ncbi:unknown [Acidiphilium sp. CAG:727]|nr:unknown [Acidiphilium sp. CAG:727]